MAVFQNSNRNITVNIANGTGTMSVVGNLSATSNVYIGGDLTVDGNVTYINITELNVEDPIISLGRGPNNTPLQSNDGLDRGENLWYYTTQEKSAFIGYKNSTGNLFAATNVTVSGEVVTVSDYGNFVVGGLISDTVIANISVDTFDANVANTIWAERVAANVLETNFVYGNLIGNVFTTGNLLMVDGVTNTLYANLAEINLVRGDVEGSVFADDSSTFFDAIDNSMFVGTASVTGNLTSNIVISTNNGNGTNFKVGDDAWIGDVNAPNTLIVKGQQDKDQGYIIFGDADDSQYLGRSNVGPLTYTGGFSATGNIDSAGNISANYYFGNGSQLTGVAAASANAETLTGTFLANNVTSSNLNTVGTLVSVSVSGNATVGNLSTAGEVSATGNVYGGNLNTSGMLSTSGNIGANNISVTTSLTANVVSASGNITGSNLLTGGLVSSAGNIVGGNLSTSGNVIGGSVLSNNLLSATGNVVGGNLLTAGLISASGNVTVGNLLTDGLISSQGNITGGNLNTSGMLSTSGNIGANNISVTTSLTANVVSASGNITGSNLLTGGLVSSAGNIVGGNLSTSGNVIGGSVLSNNLLSATGNVVGGNLLTAGLISASGNVTVGNLLTDGLISSQGNITGGNLNTSGMLSTSGNIGANNISVTTSLTGNIISASGNITGSNFLTGGLISATGTITSVANIVGGNVLTGGLVSATGTVTGSSLLGSVVSVSANITGGNILTTGQVSATGNITGSNVNTAVLRNNSGLLTIGTGSGNIDLSPAANIVVNNTYINGLANPQQDQDAATKYYVDSVATTGFAFHQPVYAATNDTLANITGGTITYAQPNGVGNGIGATLTTTGSFNLVDTANVQTVGTRILVKNQANAALNGVYTWSNATTIVRSTDADEYGADSTAALSLNDYFFVQAGNVNIGSAYIVSAPAGAITFGTSNIEFSQFSQSQVYTANTAAGLSLNGTIFNAKVDNNTTAFDGSGNIVVKASAQLTTPNIGAATGTSLSTTGTITTGNILTPGLISATGNIITGGQIQSSAFTGGNISWSVANQTDFQGAIKVGGTGVIKSPGGASSITLNNNGANMGAVGVTLSTNATSTTSGALIVTGGTGIGGNIYVGGIANISGNLNAANINTGGLLSTAGNIAANNISFNASLTGNVISVTGNIDSGNLIATNLTGTLLTASQTNITGVGTLTTGVWNATSISTTYTDAKVTSVNGSTGAITNVALTTGNLSQFASTTSAELAGVISDETGTGNLVFSNSPSFTTPSIGAATGTSLSVTGNITANNVTVGNAITASSFTVNSIAHSGTNATGDIGGTSSWFGTIYATAAEALYADLAEKYSADAKYAPGTVVSFGGSQEVTLSLEDGDRRVAGIISEKPSYTMNAGLSTEFVAVVALQGRVPCAVQGPVKKGDMMVSAGNGRARAEEEPKIGTVIGKSLEDFAGDFGTIEVAVGRI